MSRQDTLISATPAFEEIRGSWLALKNKLQALSQREVSANALHLLFTTFIDVELSQTSDLATLESQLLELTQDTIKEHLDLRDLQAQSRKYIDLIYDWFKEHASACGFENTELPPLNMTPVAHNDNETQQSTSPSASTASAIAETHLGADSTSVDPRPGQTPEQTPEQTPARETEPKASIPATPVPAGASSKADVSTPAEIPGSASTEVFASTTVPASARPKTVMHPRLWTNVTSTRIEVQKTFQHLPPAGKALIVLGTLATLAALVTLFAVPSRPIHGIAIGLKLLITTTLGATGGASMLAGSVACRRTPRGISS